MTSKYFRLAMALILQCCCCFVSDAGPSKTNSNERQEWLTTIYPAIGLSIEHPNWIADIDDGTNEWSLLAYPLVASPVSDVQYRVNVAIYKYTKEQYDRIFKSYIQSTADWINSEHLGTVQMTNEHWIYVRRDLFGSNQFAYSCVGRIKRNSTNEQVRENDQMLSADVRRILQSVVRVVATPPKLESNGPAEPSNNLGKLFNALTADEIERVKMNFSRLKAGLNPDECFKILGINGHHTFPTSSWGPVDRQHVSLMLATGHTLLLVLDAKGSAAVLISAQLDEKKWP